MWTHFFDMSSGGSEKLDWTHIYIEAPLDEARVIFYNRFGRNPDYVTCTCCGSDYSVNAIDKTEVDFSPSDNVKIIDANNIKEEERHGDVPDEGYVWV
jgi:hypothetical protein